jgi:hypothetical protein
MTLMDQYVAVLALLFILTTLFVAVLLTNAFIYYDLYKNLQTSVVQQTRAFNLFLVNLILGILLFIAWIVELVYLIKDVAENKHPSKWAAGLVIEAPLREPYHPVSESSTFRPLTPESSTFRPLTSESSTFRPYTSESSTFRPLTSESSTFRPLTSSSSRPESEFGAFASRPGVEGTVAPIPRTVFGEDVLSCPPPAGEQTNLKSYPCFRPESLRRIAQKQQRRLFD